MIVSRPLAPAILVRPLLAAWLGCGLAPAAAQEVASAAADPIQVFYPRAGCFGEEIELEVWDRASGAWRPHRVHPRVPVESCQVEDAGLLLNEIRWRCVEPAGTEPPSVWVVGLEVFDPAITESCALAPLRGGAADTDIELSAPPADRPFRSETHEAPVLGSVRLHGMEGDRYDVVIAVDRSASVRGDGVDLLGAQLDAVASLAMSLGARLGRVRIGLVSYPNVPPGPGEGTGARREIALTDDRDALLAALARLRRRGAAGMQTFASALEFGLAELSGRNPESGARARARKLLVVASDGRRSLPFGDAADGSPEFARRSLELAGRARSEGIALQLFALAGLSAENTPRLVEGLLERSGGAFSRVPHPALASPYLDALSLPIVEEVLVQNETTGRPARRAALDADGHFEARVAFVGGENRLRVRARTSEDRWAEREWTVQFDDALIVDRLLAAERDRIERAQRKHLELEAERDGAPP